MTKLISILLCVLIITFSVAGCKENDDTNTPVHTDEVTDEVSDDSQIATVSPIIEETPPDNDWKFDTPENHGVDGTLLDKLHGAIEETEIYSVVIAKDGYIISEYYKSGYDEGSVFRFNSCTKSVTSALIGIAIDKGLLSGVNTEISEFFSQIADSGSAYKQEITIEHLLEHTSGIEWSEWNGPMFRQLAGSQNWVDFVLQQPMTAKPGTTFNYTTGGSHLLSAILQQATGETAYDFAKEHLIKPLGMDSVKWRTDPQEITDGGNGISMNARDAAKFGQLYLDNGKWRDRQIVPESWVEESTTPQSAGYTRAGKYGYQWWIKDFGGYGTHGGFYAMGHGGQYIIIVPELELVTVITANFPQNIYAPQDYFTDYVLAACEG